MQLSKTRCRLMLVEMESTAAQAGQSGGDFAAGGPGNTVWQIAPSICMSVTDRPRFVASRYGCCVAQPTAPISNIANANLRISCATPPSIGTRESHGRVGNVNVDARQSRDRALGLSIFRGRNHNLLNFGKHQICETLAGVIARELLASRPQASP